MALYVNTEKSAVVVIYSHSCNWLQLLFGVGRPAQLTRHRREWRGGTGRLKVQILDGKHTLVSAWNWIWCIVHCDPTVSDWNKDKSGLLQPVWLYSLGRHYIIQLYSKPLFYYSCCWRHTDWACCWLTSYISIWIYFKVPNIRIKKLNTVRTNQHCLSVLRLKTKDQHICPALFICLRPMCPPVCCLLSIIYSPQSSIRWSAWFCCWEVKRTLRVKMMFSSRPAGQINSSSLLMKAASQ